jgi:hypothetical protein
MSNDARVVESLGLLAGLKAELIADILPMLEDRVSQMAPPAVYVSPASVQVEAPNVTVSAADLTALGEAQDETNVLLRQLIEALARPTTRTVERDSKGLITRVIEQ